MKNELAITGGSKALSHELVSFNWFSQPDISKAADLISSQQLSGFIAKSGSEHLGGGWVQSLESTWSSRVNASFGVGFNSWTSGLEAIFYSLGLEPKSEVIVPSWTMSATPAAIHHAGLNPIFCDIDEDSFNLDPKKVEELIGKNTSAICSVDIFGRPSEIHSLRKLADKNGLRLISDSAQCPTGEIDGSNPSKIADIGGFSLNRHKHIQTGEGGVVVTSDSTYLERLRALRNHGESSNPDLKINGAPVVGHNWRLGEIEALLACQQMSRVDEIVGHRVNAAKLIQKGLAGKLGLKIPEVPSNVKHDYYILGMVYDKNLTGVSRLTLAKALRAEGITFLIDEYSHVHQLPAFSNYKKGDMTVTETYNSEKFLGMYLCGNDFSEKVLLGVLDAFDKVWSNLDNLRKYEATFN